MFQTAAAKSSGPAPTVSLYERHRSEQTLLYRIVEQYYPKFSTCLAERKRMWRKSGRVFSDSQCRPYSRISNGRQSGH